MRRSTAWSSRADLDDLLRLVDAVWTRATGTGCWRCGLPAGPHPTPGRQLWPAAALAEYRLALDAPGEWAARVLVEGAGQFAPGPLPEVAASTHAWDELAPHLGPGPLARLRGPRAGGAGRGPSRGQDVDGHVLELPLLLASFEVAYVLPAFEPHRADAAPPERPALGSAVLPSPARPTDDSDSSHALRELVAVWTAESNGRVDIAAVEGDHLGAIAALGVSSVRLSEVAAPEAMAWLAWAGASGGAHGRRRGGAAGRFSAWWAAAAMGGLLEDWPVSADELGEVLDELRWFVWDANEPVLGWQLRLAVWAPAEGLAWAIAATDAT